MALLVPFEHQLEFAECSLEVQALRPRVVPEGKLSRVLSVYNITSVITDRSGHSTRGVDPPNMIMQFVGVLSD